MMSAPTSRTVSSSIALTVPAVPTGMKAGVRTVPRADIANQAPSVSIMPPMAGILQAREIRDVVAYLASLKGGGRNRESPPEN